MQSVESPSRRRHRPLRTLPHRQWGLKPGPGVALDGAKGPGGDQQSVIGYNLDPLQERKKRKCKQRGGSSSNKPVQRAGGCCRRGCRRHRGYGVTGPGPPRVSWGEGVQVPQRIWGDGARPLERTRGSHLA